MQMTIYRNIRVVEHFKGDISAFVFV